MTESLCINVFWFRFSDNEPGLLSSVFVFGSEVGKRRSKCQKKSQNKKRRSSGQKINWYLVLQSLFKLFVIYKFFVCLTVTFFVYLSQSSFVYLFQDKTEVRVFEVENAGENEKIVEISTGPKGSKKYLTCFMLILREFVGAAGRVQACTKNNVCQFTISLKNTHNYRIQHNIKPASSSGASFFAWQRRARNASDWWWTSRDHWKGTPFRLPLHAHRRETSGYEADIKQCFP